MFMLLILTLRKLEISGGLVIGYGFDGDAVDCIYQFTFVVVVIFSCSEPV